MTDRLFRAQVAILLASALLVLGSSMPIPVSAASFHHYSHAWENSGSANYVGMQVTRLDRAVTGQPSTGCSVPFQGSPVYQTQWFHFAGGHYYELGTGHQCNDGYRYWFAGVEINDVWSPIGTLSGRVNGIQHVFQIDRVSSGPGTYAWKFRVDGVIRWSWGVNSLMGDTADLGLESWCQGCGVLEYSSSSLRVLKGTVWSPFSGTDGLQVGTEMCGQWVGTQSWVAGQGPGC